MRLKIIAVGRMKDGPEHDLYTDYISRLERTGTPLGIGPCTTIEIDERKARTSERGWADTQIIDKAAPATVLVALDERGQSISSKTFASRLTTWRDDGTSEVAFAIGGADGHGGAIRSAANHLISFGDTTWPHMLFRVMLAEQLYRAVSIMANHPYHRE